ncbi:MAG: DNA/RNA non-specific endonuclease [Bacteroidales bacterium]|nr:DNA/RNA non-specific endonuclease [Bacteroidales bacterium]
MKHSIFKSFNLWHCTWCLGAVLALSACSDDPYDFDGVVLGVESKVGKATAADARMTEVPTLQKGDLFVTHNLITTSQVGDEIVYDTVMNYCLAYDTVQFHSRWVAFRFDGSNRAKNTGRSGSDAFQDDPEIASKYYIGYNGFGSGYDRGHLCASNDRLLSEDANRQTFYMTNMSPQMSQFNQEYWVEYEQYVQGLGRDASFSDTLYVVKGGTIGNDQTLGYVYRNNGKQVAIPKYYFMALLKCKSSGYEAIAFWMEHKEYDVEADKAEMARHAISIDELEELTGIDFFSNLPDVTESEVEKTVTLASWKLN